MIQAIMNCGNKSTLSWNVTIFTFSWYVSMSGFIEKNTYDGGDIMQAGIKHADI